ncbi:hypothetical protein DXA02_04585 [Ruminococcus sp. AM54-1NS]|jgi:hypothetical protein|nr:hypothetical protein DXA02_04585 [Ruminococcus sp. AM54-1NS]DAZ83355.1 MAG TPA: hypothetical protein [Caudoviricetes sp.]
MSKKFTDEEVVEAALCCTAKSCNTCPFIVLGVGFEKCVIKFSEYIANNTKNEPALSANSTSSEVVSKDTDNIHLDDSIKQQICQAYDTVDEACGDIIDIYEVMSEREHRAFNIGEVYGKICSTRNKLEELRGGDGNDG